MFRFLLLLFAVILISSFGFAQKKQTYKKNGTTYLQGEYYKTTHKPKVRRSNKARQEFLKKKGYNKAPNGYEVDHILPLHQGGSDTPSNMQLLTKEQHRRKTATERKKVKKRKSKK